jgi:hypothetical protein
MHRRARVCIETLEQRQLLSAAVGPSALTASAGVKATEISSRTFNVKNYGAKGNATADDRSAIQAAINAMKSNGGGTLVFPSGIYRISKAVRIEKTSKFIVSAVGATIKPFGSVSPNYATGDILQISSCSSFTINGLTFDGNERSRKGGFPAESLRMDGVSDFRLTGCTFTDAVLDDIYIAANSSKVSSKDGVIENCTLDGARRNSISVIAGQRIEITNNRISNVRGADPGDGILIESNATDAEGANRDIVINRNTFSNVDDSGVSVIPNRSPKYITIDSNEFVNCPTGVRIMTTQCVVSNNFFHDAVRPTSGRGSQTLGQIVTGGYNGGVVTIDSNRIENIKDMSGIYVHITWTGSANVENNTVKGLTNSKYPVIHVWTSNATVTGNGIDQCAGMGIVVAGNNANIGANLLTNGNHVGIYSCGTGGSIWRNTVVDYGIADAGLCIIADGGTIGSSIYENVIRHWDTPNWTGMRVDSRDILTANSLQGVSIKTL